MRLRHPHGGVNEALESGWEWGWGSAVRLGVGMRLWSPPGSGDEDLESAWAW